MKSWKSELLLAGMVTLGCSGRYEVGGLDDEAGGSGGSGASSTAAAGTTVAPSSGGSADAGPGEPGGEFGPQCVAAGLPQPLSGDLASPATVWARLSPFIWGGAQAPPSDLPSMTSYAWAGEVVDSAFAERPAAGGSWFIRRWLGLPAEANLEGDYDAMGRDDRVALRTLLLTSWQAGRSGVFAERAWLSEHPGMAPRGAALAAKLFGLQVPPPPPDLDVKLDSTQGERAALESSTMSSPSCLACHVMFNGLGFALGHFDHLGDYRTLDQGQPIDASGSFPTQTRRLEFDGIADLGQQAAETCDASRSLVRGFLEVAVTEQGYTDEVKYTVIEANTERVLQAFVAGGRSYPALVRAFAQSPLALRP